MGVLRNAAPLLAKWEQSMNRFAQKIHIARVTIEKADEAADEGRHSRVDLQIMLVK